MNELQEKIDDILNEIETFGMAINAETRDYIINLCMDAAIKKMDDCYYTQIAAHNGNLVKMISRNEVKEKLRSLKVNRDDDLDSSDDAFAIEWK